MATGVDFSFSRVPPAVAKAAGHTFAVSYLTDLDTAHKAKAWTAAEVQAYRAAGLGVVAVWQGGGSDRTTAWRGGYDRGRRDALRAATQATALGRPAGRPVYFAVDADASLADLALISRYFDGVLSVFDAANVGVYGGRRTIEWAMSSGRVSWFWQTGAWSNGVVLPGIHLYQRIPSTKLGGYDIDIDDAMQADCGGWFTEGMSMAWCPFAQRMELQPESNSQVAIKPTQFILHSIAAPWTVQRIFEYWRDSTNLESHFGLGFDGSLGQFIGTQTRADASAQANVRAISLESASNLEHTDPWTDAQVATIIRLGVWLCQTHGIPARRPTSWDAPGIGYHRMYPQWSIGGTACPGDARVRQFDSLILPGIQRGLAGGPTTSPTQETEMTPDERRSLVAEVTAAVVAALPPALLDQEMPPYTWGPANPDGTPGYRPSIGECIGGSRFANSMLEGVGRQLTALDGKVGAPVPVQVDAAALVAAMKADPEFMQLMAKADADETHKRMES